MVVIDLLNKFECYLFKIHEEFLYKIEYFFPSIKLYFAGNKRTFVIPFLLYSDTLTHKKGNLKGMSATKLENSTLVNKSIQIQNFQTFMHYNK